MLEPHSSAWPEEFEQLAAIYRQALGSLAVRVEHVGSTAVPGLLAKPILDIDIVIASYRTLAPVASCLALLGYTHNGDQGIPEREAFKPADTAAPRTTPPRSWMKHHLYVCPEDSRELRRHLRFRDALRRDTALRAAYEGLKLDFARRSAGDRKRYDELKSTEARAFFAAILADSAIPRPTA